MSDCIFCKIVAGEIPSAKVYEDDNCLAFLDIGPLADGHVLIVPKEHYEQITDMPPEQVAALTQPIPQIAQAVIKATGAAGFNILQNNGQVSGQEVMHVHVHIIPRAEADGLGYRWNAKKYPEGKMEQLQEAIRDSLEE